MLYDVINSELLDEDYRFPMVLNRALLSIVIPWFRGIPIPTSWIYLFTLFAVLWLVADADLLWEKSTAGWLVAAG